jgi:hypothetical protein
MTFYRTTKIVRSKPKMGLQKMKLLREEKDRVKEMSQGIKDARKTARREEENKKW